jgi:hypothetical protein
MTEDRGQTSIGRAADEAGGADFLRSMAEAVVLGSKSQTVR